MTLSVASRTRRRGPASVTQAAARGFIWAFGQNIGFRLAAFVGQLALARLLTPADFGQVSLALTINNIVIALTDFGLEDILMSRRKALDLWLGPAYCLSLVLSCLGAALMLAAAPLAAVFYQMPALTGLTAVLAVNAVVSGLSTVPNIKLRAELRFGLTSGYVLGEFIASQVLAVGFAWAGAGAFAFVLPHPILAAIKAVIFRRLAPVRLSGTLRQGRWRHLLGRGSLVFGQRLLQSLREQGDYAILGLFASQAVVGAYFLGFRLAAQPVYALVRSLGAVLFPALSILSGEPERQILAATRAARILAFVITPLSFLQAAAAEPIILFLFGPEWRPAVPFLEVLSIGLAFDTLPCVAGALASARGRFGFQFRAAAAMTSVFLICILTGVTVFGPIGVAWGVTISFLLNAFIYSLFAFGPMPHVVRTLVGLLAGPTLLSAVAVGVGRFTELLIAGDEPWLRLLVLTTVSGASYLLLMVLFARSTARELQGEAERVVRALRRRG